jgi:hypothetical protein
MRIALTVLVFGVSVICQAAVAQSLSAADRAALRVAVAYVEPLEDIRKSNRLGCHELVKYELQKVLVGRGFTVVDVGSTQRTQLLRTILTADIAKSSLDKSAIEQSYYDVEIGVRLAFDEAVATAQHFSVELTALDLFSGSPLVSGPSLESKKRKFSSCEQAVRTTLEVDAKAAFGQWLENFDKGIQHYKDNGRPARIKFELELESGRSFNDILADGPIFKRMETLVKSLAVDGVCRMIGASDSYLGFEFNMPLSRPDSAQMSASFIRESLDRELRSMGLEVLQNTVIGSWFNVLVR